MMKNKKASTLCRGLVRLAVRFCRCVQTVFRLRQADAPEPTSTQVPPRAGARPARQPVSAARLEVCFPACQLLS